MLRFLKKKQPNKVAESKSASALRSAQQRIFWQIGLVLVTVVLTIVIVFTMTSAWYTNVVQTSGMVIQAESWGFEGEIEVDESVIVASPGDEGAISLKVNNTNETTTAVSVAVSKARIADSEMQKRLYFYVDTQMTRNGEVMEQVYLNTQDSYTYTLFGGQTLALTEEMHSDVPLKWQWVYDVLGYYVLGTWSNERDSLTEMEYLRPIEYDYDEATTTFRTEEGELLMELGTVDGETTVDEFLVEFSRKDGYSGTIDPNQKKGNGYYPVAVDENGYGVYAYLCTYTDIELATQYDTNLAQASVDAEKEGGSPQTYEIQLMLSAQKHDEDVVHVNSVEGLNTALELETANVVQLSGDISVTSEESLVIPAGKQITLDLNGHSIISQSGDRAVSAKPGSNLTMRNGKVQGAGDTNYGVHSVGAKVTMSQVEISGFQYGVYTSDNNDGNTQESTVRLVDCQIDGSICAVFVAGNGTASEQMTQVVIENCKLSSDNIVLSGNGNVAGDGRWGTDIQIINSELIGNPEKLSAGIYHPQKNSNLTIYNSDISAYTAIALKGGNVQIIGSRVTGTGAAPVGEINPSGSGFVDTGDAVYIEANYDYPVRLEIRADEKQNLDSVLESKNSRSLRVYPEDASHVQVILYSGRYNEEQPQAYLADGAAQSASGNYFIIQS